MNKTVNCPSCKAGYNLDLDKYGGKKIKCKQCQGIIAVPTTEQAADEFEVVEESASPVTASRMPPSPPIPPNAPPSILQRNRMASQRGAVNIALLQRNELNRQEIRDAFLDVHGSRAARLPDDVLPLINAEEEIDKQLAEMEVNEKVRWLKDVLARSMASEGSAPSLTSFLAKMGEAGFGNAKVDDAYTYALSITGRPIRPIPAEQSRSGWEGFTDGLNGKYTKDLEARKSQIRDIKLDTIRAAIEVSENMHTMLMQEKTSIDRDYEKIIVEHSKVSKLGLARARDQVFEDKLSDATITLQELIKTAPTELLGQVLVAMSQCTYLSGNASNAARNIQDAICFGASAPVDMDEGYNDLWAKASFGLPRS